MLDQSKYDIKNIEELVELLLGETPYSRETYVEIDSLLTDPQYSSETEEALARVWEKIGELECDPAHKRSLAEKTMTGIVRKCPDFPATPIKTIPFFRSTLFKVAAVLAPFLILAGALSFWYFADDQSEIIRYITESTSSPITDVADETTVPEKGDSETMPACEFTNSTGELIDTSAEPEAPAMLYVLADGEERELILPDGSLVRLAAGSELGYGTDFSQHRYVTLEGNAFFSVTKMEGKPFEVAYNEVTVTVLGTEFFLNDYGTKLEVTLKSGAVEVFAAEQSVILSPNQQFVMDFGSADFSVIELSEGQMANMIRGRLSFSGTPLCEAIARTGEFFGVDIDLSLTSREPVRMEFDAHDTLDDVLFILQQISGHKFDYRITGSCVMITQTESN